MQEKKSSAPVWKKKNPKKTRGQKSIKLTALEKEEARERARKAGRRYPNLVDNMAVTKKRKK